MKTMIMFISGLVQGTGFRNFAKKEADSLKIKGYVKNLEDGRVEVAAQGNEESLGKLENILWKGPRSSDVYTVDVEWEDMKEFSSFQIKI